MRIGDLGIAPIAAALLLLVGCGAQANGVAASPKPADDATVSSPDTCQVRGSGKLALPDPSCTPGQINPGVTQQDIQQTICRKGWTKTVRPPESYTSSLKRQQMRAYGETAPTSTVEEDHLIPLELGGAPSDPKNLWPEPNGLPSPNEKDRTEGAANAAVCSGRMPLATAQQKMAANWVQLGQELGT